MFTQLLIVMYVCVLFFANIALKFNPVCVNLSYTYLKRISIWWKKIMLVNAVGKENTVRNIIFYVLVVVVITCDLFCSVIKDWEENMKTYEHKK